MRLDVGQIRCFVLLSIHVLVVCLLVWLGLKAVPLSNNFLFEEEHILEHYSEEYTMSGKKTSKVWQHFEAIKDYPKTSYQFCLCKLFSPLVRCSAQLNGSAFVL